MTAMGGDDGFAAEEAAFLDDMEAASGGGVSQIVAIVGRPNVGKSTLFNRLTRSRKAIVEDRPGVTRDRLYGVAHFDDRSYVVVDTGGLDPELNTGLPKHIRVQAEVAIQEADLILFVVDAAEGLSGADHEIGTLLRKSGKPLIVVANKADNPERELAGLSANELGLGEVLPVSAAHGRNVGELCEAILERLPEGAQAKELIPEGTRIAFIGRPNAGKSTLVNATLAEPRVIVSAEPGTTRDPINLPFRYKDRDLVLIDTAGLRRRKQVARAMEKIAAIRSIRTIEQTHVCVLVIDATAGVRDQDQRIARMAFERGKAVVVALHKWDLVVKDGQQAREALEQCKESLAFLESPLIVKTSVVGQGRDEGAGHAFELEKLLTACLKTAAALDRRISTSDLNEELQAAVRDHSPPLHKSRPVKLYFATQASASPPLIVISANRGRCLVPAWERYFIRRLRKRWGLFGVPVRLVVRGRGRGNAERRGGR